MIIEFSAVKENSTVNSFKISKSDLKSYEENLKWESTLVSDALHETRKRKYFAINASLILFPGFIGGMLTVASYIGKVDIDKELVLYYWVTVVTISMFMGMANMITIKYIAAYKAQANLFIRQLNCLRQARDSVTYYKFEGKFPENLMLLREQESLYYKIFGKHRKLYIGNEELRDRLVGSFSESADKSLIGFLFLTSLTLISAPYIYLSAVSLKHWSDLSEAHFVFFEKAVSLISLNIVFISLSIILLMLGHWKNFTKLRTGDAISNLPEEEGSLKNERDVISKKAKIGKGSLADYISLGILFMITLYCIHLGWVSDLTIFKIIMIDVSFLVLALYVIEMTTTDKEQKDKQQENKNTYEPLFNLKRTDYISMALVSIISAYWIYLGWNSGISVFKILILALSLVSLFLILICVKKVFFDSLNRIHKALVYKLEFSQFKTD